MAAKETGRAIDRAAKKMSQGMVAADSFCELLNT